MSMREQLEAMTVGECRWVEREDMHVYCWGSRIGKRYDPTVKVYKLWAGKTVGSVWDRDGWTTADNVIRSIKKRLASKRK